ncbi:MAG: histidine kinase dimerization/phospho-acceptor domain-containing protein [Sarcina sp.]
MKKIVKLKYEFMIAGVFSLIVGGVLAISLSSLVEELIFKNRDFNELANKRNESVLENLYHFVDTKSQDEQIVYQGLEDFKNNFNSNYGNNAFIVDNNGNVKLTHSNLGIKQIDISAGEGKFISINNQKYVGKNIFKINDDSILVLLYENYIDDDLNVIVFGMILSGFIFIMIVTSRVKYITEISNSLRKIAKGDLTSRVDIKYKNELRTLGEDINYMAEELQREDQEQREFITNISHDLRTPLTTMLGYLKMLDAGTYKNEDELKKYIKITSRKGNNLKTMIDDFFDYAKISSNDIDEEKVLINLNEMILQLISEEEIHLQEKNLSIKVELDNSSIFTYVNPMLIYRAFNNLISNAIKYSKESTEITIKLKLEECEAITYGVLYVANIPRDKITREHTSKLFKRLYKVDKSRNDKGSGLGLVITEEIIKNHNGFVKVDLVEEKIIFSIGLIREVI